jgi:hypothetical protein
MGREMFRQLRESVERFEDQFDYHKLYLYGTIGYGKSHMLAALACLLMQEGKRVVFLPDCRAMMQEGFGRYLSAGLLLCFGDSPSRQQEITECGDDPDKLDEFCHQLSSRKVFIYFIIDQINAFDSEHANEDDVEDEVKSDVQKRITKIASRHYGIWSASANHKSAVHMARKLTNDIKIAVYGGYTMARGPISCG